VGYSVVERKRTVKRPELPGKRLRERGKANTYGGAWKRLRLVVLSAEPWCRMCGRLARDVDHIVPVRVRPDLAMDRDNLQPLCVPCHKGAKARQDNEKYGTAPASR
jgi:5-methylcytosine-specific restriction endonuclease McrA